MLFRILFPMPHGIGEISHQSSGVVFDVWLKVLHIRTRRALRLVKKFGHLVSGSMAALLECMDISHTRNLSPRVSPASQIFDNHRFYVFLVKSHIPGYGVRTALRGLYLSPGFSSFRSSWKFSSQSRRPVVTRGNPVLPSLVNQCLLSWVGHLIPPPAFGFLGFLDLLALGVSLSVYDSKASHHSSSSILSSMS